VSLTPKPAPAPARPATPVGGELVRTVLAEDEVLLRAGLSELLARFGFVVCATAADAPGLVAAVAEHEPALVVTDIRMPPGFRDEGLRTAIALRAERPALAVVVLSQYVEPDLAADLLDSRSGRGIGYLLKDRVADVGAFVTALHAVAAGALRSTGSRRASGRCWRWWPRGIPTWRWPGCCASPRRWSASTSAAC
jgi:DNA-binding NarL/FixJ family response regulator